LAASPDTEAEVEDEVDDEDGSGSGAARRVASPAFSMACESANLRAFLARSALASLACLASSSFLASSRLSMSATNCIIAPSTAAASFGDPLEWQASPPLWLKDAMV
jgi:hypothetical protein